MDFLLSVFRYGWILNIVSNRRVKTLSLHTYNHNHKECYRTLPIDFVLS